MIALTTLKKMCASTALVMAFMFSSAVSAETYKVVHMNNIFPVAFTKQLNEYAAQGWLVKQILYSPDDASVSVVFYKK